MSLQVTCDQCGASLTVSPQVTNVPIACPLCGHVFSLQQPVEASDDEMLEFADADVVVLEDASDDRAESEVELVAIDNESHAESSPGEVPLASTSPTAPADANDPAPAMIEPTVGDTNIQQTENTATQLSPVLAALAGAGITLILLLIGGVGWWIVFRSGSRTGAAAANSGALEGSEMPWDAADDNRHRRHNRPPIEQPSEKKVNTFQRIPSAAEIRATAKIESSPPKPEPVGDNPTRDRRSVIDEIKSATIYIRVTTSKGVQSGSGFLFQRSNNWGTIVTNAHVVEPEEGKLETIECTFFSGTSREFSVTAKVSCKDKQSDLAFLRVYHEKIPAAVHLAKDVEIRETDTVLVAGFPFGEVLKTSNRNPSITITQGTVSSIRLDDYDSVSLLQIDGGINPGNSGGPVVLEDGRLVGVAVAKVRGTDIGFAIPTRVLQQTVLGRLTRVEIEKTDDGRGHYQFEIRFIDPTSQVQATDLIVFRDSDQTIRQPNDDGSWRPAAVTLLASERLRMRRLSSNGELQANGELQIPSEENLVFQTRFARRGGGEHWSRPLKFPDSLELGVASTVPLTGESDQPEIPQQEVKIAVAVLPAMMSDFAINPSTGDIACLDPAKDRAHLIRAGQLLNADYLSSPNVSIGKAPCSVAFKRYREDEYFVVACADDSHLYLLSADLLEVVEKVPVVGDRVSQVFASSNSEDPFVYYKYGLDNDSRAGAIDLRRMTDCGKVFDNSTNCSISANGRFVYRRKSLTQPGFDSLRMTSEFAAPVPTFELFHYEDRATGTCLPGPLGQFVASGKSIYSIGLEKHVFAMSFTPACFFRSRPVIVGLTGTRGASKQSSILRAASFNTFESATTTLILPQELTDLAIMRPSDNRSEHVLMRTRVIADDANQRVVYAASNKLALIPLKAFRLRDDEPFLNLASNSAELRVGVEQRIELRATNERVSLEVNDLPDGMKQLVSGLSWKPRDQDVGTTTIPITLRFEKAERTIDFQARVQQAWIDIPIDLTDFLIGPDSSFCVCWSGYPVDGSRYPIDPANGNRANGSQLCVMPLRRGFQPITKELPFVISQAVLLGGRVALLPAEDDRQVHVFDLRTLQREKLLLSTSPVKTIEVSGKRLLLHGDENVDVYSVETLQHLESMAATSATSNEQPSRVPANEAFVDGTIANGILLGGSDSAPMLLLSPGELPTLPGAQSDLFNGSFLRRVAAPQVASSRRGSSQSNVSIVAGPLAIPEEKLRVSLENRVNVLALAGSNEIRRMEQHVMLLVSGEDGSLIARVPILKQPMLSSARPNKPVMHVSGNKVMIGCGSRLYRWTPSALRRKQNGQQPASSGGRRPEELHFVPTQSAFVADGQTTLLRHQLAGGSPPHDLFLMARFSGVELNQQSGDVTLSRDALLRAAAPLLTAVAQSTKSGNLIEEFQDRSLELAEEFERLTGSRLRGFPVAVPIHLKASDRQGNVAEIQYFVCLDVSLDEVTAAIGLGLQLDEQNN